MKLTTYLAFTAGSICTWLFLKPSLAKLEMPKPKRMHPVHHKRNGMKTHKAH